MAGSLLACRAPLCLHDPDNITLPEEFKCGSTPFPGRKGRPCFLLTLLGLTLLHFLILVATGISSHLLTSALTWWAEPP
jgi:hypothetical protein